MGLGKLIVTAFALSLDNLAAGFALGTLHVSVAEAAIVIGAVSVLMSLAGLELGGRLGAAAGRRGEQIGGAILVGGRRRAGGRRPLTRSGHRLAQSARLSASRGQDATARRTASAGRRGTSPAAMCR